MNNLVTTRALIRWKKKQSKTKKTKAYATSFGFEASPLGRPKSSGNELHCSFLCTPSTPGELITPENPYNMRSLNKSSLDNI